MIIEVPRVYKFVKEGDIIAFEENGKLKLRAWKARFNDVMYDLTYRTKGNTRCHYCKEEVEKTKITLDHVYPRALGGPTLPQNLVPACRDCNAKKGDMTPDQFRAYMNLSNSAD